MKSSKDYYSRIDIAKTYDRDRFTTPGDKMFDTFEKNIVISNLLKVKCEDVKILDAGAGSGRFTIEMAMRGYNVVACDYSLAMLDIIKSKIEENNIKNYVTLSKQDITNLAFNDSEFDFICCMRVFVNLDTKENVITALKELVRVCKPGGTIVFDIVNPKSLAIFGPKKESMVTLKEAKDMILSIPGIKIRKCFGRRILSQTIFKKSPKISLIFIDKIDHILSIIFVPICIRIYFVLEKEGK